MLIVLYWGQVSVNALSTPIPIIPTCQAPPTSSGSTSSSQRPCDPVDCGLRTLALFMSSTSLPGCQSSVGSQTVCQNQLNSVALALQIPVKCSINSASALLALVQKAQSVQQGNASRSSSFMATASSSLQDISKSVFVDPIHGSDRNSGLSKANAVRTIAAGLKATRQATGGKPRTSGSPGVQLILLKGKHRLTQPLVFTPADSYTNIQGDSSGAVLSGAVLLSNLNWQPSDEIPGAFVTPLSKDILNVVGPLSVLSVNGVQAIRAQYPNKNSVTDQAFLSENSISRWYPRLNNAPLTNRISVPIDIPNQILHRYTNFVSATGGSCTNQFTPPTGYFCNPNADADGKCPYSTPGGFTVRNGLAKALKMDKWSNRTTGFVNILHRLKWGGWSYQIGSSCQGINGRIPRKWNSLCIPFGGFQESRGDCGRGGGDFFVENIKELLDYPNEFFLDLNEGNLYFYPPTADFDFSSAEFELGTIGADSLLQLRGQSSSTPITNINIAGLQFERTYPTHLFPHEMPSGGDWSVHRGGALFIENAQNIHVSDCSFTNLGSNGIFVSKYARNVIIERNTLSILDGSGILVVGDPKYESPTPWDRTSDLDWPQAITVQNNWIHDIGLREFQAAGIFTSIAKQTLYTSNVIHDGPRAGIIFNDLFGGLHTTMNNILFNLVEITLDHGPYNTWDRQKWMLPKPSADGGGNDFYNSNQVMGNFIMGNVNGPKLVDLDDASRNHLVSNNVLAYGYMKFKGFNISTFDNQVFAYRPFISSSSQTIASAPLSCAQITASDSRYDARYSWTNNTCFRTTITSSNPKPVSSSVPTFLYAGANSAYCTPNQFYTAFNEYYGVNPTTSFKPCTTSLTSWLSTYQQDKGSTFTSAQPNLFQTVQLSASLLWKLAT